MNEENEKSGILKWVIIALFVILLLVLGIFLVMRFAKDSTIATTIGGVLPFGQLGEEAPRPLDGDLVGGGGGEQLPPPVSTSGKEPLFRQLSTREVAGATALTRDGKTYIRYVLRDKGNIYEIDTTTWAVRQLTNTTIPQVYEARFGNNGSSVVLRYLKLDPSTGLDVIKTHIGDIVLPENFASTPSAVGVIRGNPIADNVSEISISPDGTKLFTLIPNQDGVRGYAQDFNSSLSPREVFESTFSEWLPQLQNDGTIILSTKPSAQIPGFAYQYDPNDKSMTRIVREKNGLTTLADRNGVNALFGENIAGVSTLGVYNKAGWSDHGETVHEAPIPLTSLPEKCAWGKNGRTVFCGAFGDVATKSIPDEWYQGLVSLADTFWTINTRTQEIQLIAEPQKEVQKNFDVYAPFLDENEQYFFFIDKNTSMLWSLRLLPSADTEMDVDFVAPAPNEEKDALGSLPE